MAQGYLIFHLNLAFSSIEAEARPAVIQKCYWPLLDLAESTGIPIGIELTGWTLQQINLIDPAWVVRFRTMLEKKECELIGSGWSQIIGPLVPYEVNRWNQQLGLEAYQAVLGVTPSIALVNEMAFSTSMVDVYAEAGYRAIITDRDNIRLALGLNNSTSSSMPTHAQGCGSLSLPVLWSDSILFQRLQRVVHGDIPVSEYYGYVQARRDSDNSILPIYCNDAEIFDYRPGRFATEGQVHLQGEWSRMGEVLSGLECQMGLKWISPSDAVEIIERDPHKLIQKLTSIQQPIPVKKQAKYNINRWALTGRDNLWLNTQCHQIYQFMMDRNDTEHSSWKRLCELWASDLRTHITEARWIKALSELEIFKEYLGLSAYQNSRKVSLEGREFSPLLEEDARGFEITRDDEDIYWTIKTPSIHLTINLRRGLAIKSLAFRSHQFSPLIATLGQGFFDAIDLGADYYSAGVVIEMPGEHKRITDLERVIPILEQSQNHIRIKVAISTGGLDLVKTITLSKSSECIELGYAMNEMIRPLGSVRVAILTFDTEQFKGPLFVGFKSGGREQEVLAIDTEFNHSQSVSPLVSSTTSFGTSDGRLVIGSKSRAIQMTWDPSECAAVPMLMNRRDKQKNLTRVLFSKSEMDDTFKPGGKVIDFSLHIQPTQSF